MTATHFTEGPWALDWQMNNHDKSSRIYGPMDISDLNEPVAIIPHDDISDAGAIEAEANAYLIAAAPELYEALEILHDSLAEYVRINNLGGFDNHDMKMARAALASARGETS